MSSNYPTHKGTKAGKAATIARKAARQGKTTGLYLPPMAASAHVSLSDSVPVRESLPVGFSLARAI
jgi:hypothetical protein